MQIQQNLLLSVLRQLVGGGEAPRNPKILHPKSDVLRGHTAQVVLMAASAGNSAFGNLIGDSSVVGVGLSTCSGPSPKTMFGIEFDWTIRS